jgi:hypothetical protein
MKKLAEYFNVSLSAAYKWSAETIRRKTIIMESGAEPEIIKLIGEISQLCYIYSCKEVRGEHLGKSAKLDFTAIVAHLKIMQPDGRCAFSLAPVDLTLSTAVAELQKVKATLESFIY